MSDDGQQLLLTFEAKFERYMRNFERAQQQTDRRFKSMEQRAKEAGERMERSLRSSTANINQLLAGLGAGAGLNQLQQLAERWTDVTSRVNIAAGSQEKGAAVMERVSQIARRTYSDLGQTAEAYIANSTAMKELGYSTQTQLDYTEALNNALVVSGAKGQRAESVMNALSKAMALGKLPGDNLNTVLSTGGRVAQALADGLGVGVNQLRQLGSEGKLTGDKIVKALTGELEKLREEAESMPATISDAMVLLRNSLTEYVGKLNEANGVTSVFADGIIFAADHIGSIASAAAAAGAVILSGYVPALGRAAMAQAAMVATNPFLALAAVIGAATFALSAFGDEITPIPGDLANLQDYAGAAWTGIKDGVLTAGTAIRDTLITAINFLSSAIGGAEISFGDLADFVKQIVNQIVGEFVFVYETIVNVFTQLPAAIAEAVISAMNSMIAGVEKGLNAVVEAVNSTIGAISSVSDAVGLSLGTIGAVTLGRIGNAYAGAGEAAGKAYGEALKKAAQDHVGNALGAWRTAANERAAARIASEGQGSGNAIDSKDNPTTPAGAGAGSGRGGRGGRGNEFDREVLKLQERIAALRAESDARRGLTGTLEQQEAALEKARIKQELLSAAQKAGMAITPDLEAKIDALAQSYVDASGEAKRLADAQQQAQQTAQDWANFGGSLVSGFVNDLRQGKSAAEALSNAVGKITDKLIDMAIQMLIVKPLLGMFGFSGGGFVDGAGGGFAGLIGYDSGGYTGHGGKYEPAGVVHRGEYVMSKEATSRIGVGNLEALHRGALAGFAAGGYVGDSPAVRRAHMPANDNASIAQPIQIHSTVNVNANGGDPAANADLAAKVSKQVEQQLRGVVQDEVRRQGRPGGYLNTRSR
jgi:lambda family phage tail tape measure protein